MHLSTLEVSMLTLRFEAYPVAEANMVPTLSLEESQS